MADDQPELHELTKMLLLRMDVHPEEFYCGPTGPESRKWATSLSAIKYCGTPEDIAAINKAYMDLVLQSALKVLLAPEGANAAAVGQNPVGIPNTGNVSVVVPNHYGVFGGNGGNGGPSPTMQQAQAAMQQAHQPMWVNSVTVHPSAGFSVPTAKNALAETYEQLKKRLGL